MEWELRRLPRGTRKYAEGKPGDGHRAQHPGHSNDVDVWDLEWVEALSEKELLTGKQVQDGYEKPHISYTGDQKRLLCGSGSGRSLIPEADEQIGAQTHQLPEDVEL